MHLKQICGMHLKQCLGEIYNLNAYTNKVERSHTSSLNFYHKKLENNKNKTKTTRRKKTIEVMQNQGNWKQKDNGEN